MALSDKQKRFVQEYLVDLNATAAATRAGYKNPNKHGPRMLVNDGIAKAIREVMTARATRYELTNDRILKELMALGLGDIGEVLDFTGQVIKLKPANQISESGRRMLSAIKVKRSVEKSTDVDAEGKPIFHEVEVTEFKLWDKVSALEKLGKHLGLFPNKVEVEHKGAVQIIGITVAPTAPATIPIENAKPG